MGCVSRVTRGAKADSSGSFHYHDIEQVDTRSISYLPFESFGNSTSGSGSGGGSKLRKIFVYRVVDSIRSAGGSGRGAMAIFVIDGVDNNDSENNNTTGISDPSKSQAQYGHPLGFTARAFVWFANPTGTLSANMTPPLQRIFRKFCGDSTARCRLVGVQVRSMSEAATGCGERLSLM
eukprot:gene16786-22776_t